MVNQIPDEGICPEAPAAAGDEGSLFKSYEACLPRATIGSEGSLFADPHKPRGGRMLITCRGRGGALTLFISAISRRQFWLTINGHERV